MRKDLLNKIPQALLILLTGFLLINRIPGILQNYQVESKKISPFSIETINAFTFESSNKKIALIFWATWCGPCKIELSRINQLIKNNKIEARNILAISMDDNLNIVKQFIQKENYQFPVAMANRSSLTKELMVTVTPTIVLLSKDSKIEWISSGLSPLLSYRLCLFFAK